MAVGDGWAAALTRDQTVGLCTEGGTPFFALETLGVPDRLTGRSDRASVFSHLVDSGHHKHSSTCCLEDGARNVSLPEHQRCFWVVDTFPLLLLEEGVICTLDWAALH